MKFDHLLSFQQVAVTGSFTRAAQKLYITQPTVTQHIQSLEKELNVKLFYRTKADTRLTPAGQVLLESVESILEILERTRAAFTENKNLAGDLSIAASTIMGTYFLPRYIAPFIRKHPSVRFSMNYGNSHGIAEWVQNGVVDLGFAPYSSSFAKLTFCFVHREKCAFAVDKASPLAAKKVLSVDDLCATPILVREKGTRIGEVVTQWIRTRRWPGPPPSLATCSDMDAIKKIVENGGGVTILPRSALKREFAFGLLHEVTVPDAALYVDYYLVRKQTEMSQAARAFVDFMQELSGLDLQCE